MATATTSEQQEPSLSLSGSTRTVYSHPVFKKTLTLNSLQAQRVKDRSFSRVCNSLYSTDVILRIIADQEEIDQVDAVITDLIEQLSADLRASFDQATAVMVDNGIDGIASYSHPKVYEIEITSPQIAHFVHLLHQLDALMGVIDTLWLNAIIGNKQRTDSNYLWQKRLFKLASSIIGLEKRARVAANNKGKQNEVEQAAPSAAAHELDTAAESEKVELDVGILAIADASEHGPSDVAVA